MIERILVDLRNIKTIATHFNRQDIGRLALATTHTQARYSLPAVAPKFKEEFPGVELVLHQGGPAEMVALLMSGAADITIATEALDSIPELVTFPFYRWHHAVIVPDGHPLLRSKRLTLEEIVEFPIITYSEGSTGRARVDEAFGKAGIVPNIAISAIDADVIKTYVELGLGVGIVAAMAVESDRDSALHVIASEHLFEANTTRLAVRRGNYLRGLPCRFIQRCASSFTEAAIRKAIMAIEKEQLIDRSRAGKSGAAES